MKKNNYRRLIMGILAFMELSMGSIAVAQGADFEEGLTGDYLKDKMILNVKGVDIVKNKEQKNIVYNFKGKNYVFNVLNQDGISISERDFNHIYNNVDSKGKKGTIYIRQKNTGYNDWASICGINGYSSGKVIFNSHLDITASAAYASAGVSTGVVVEDKKTTTIIINGDVKMRRDDPNNPWGIKTKNVHGNLGPGGVTSMDGTDHEYTGARWQPYAFGAFWTRGDIIVNGNIDVAVRGTAVLTSMYYAVPGVNAYDLATISLLGDSIRIETPVNEKSPNGDFIEPYYSMASYGGSINVNVKKIGRRVERQILSEML